MNTEGLEMLKHRRSVRKFQTKQIETEILNQILEAGTYAPTANGKQQPVIVAVQNADTVMKIDTINVKIQKGTGTSLLWGTNNYPCIVQS